jgi:apolipoprotein N-acyltransferase
MLLIDFLEGKKQRLLRPINIASMLVVIAMIAGTILYGNKRISETEKYIEKSPLIGSVQPNVPSNIKELSEAGDAILDDLITETRACFDAGAVLVAWPETMVLSTMNWQYIGVCKQESRPVVFHKRIAELSKDNGYVLFGAHAVDVEPPVDGYVSLGVKYNSAFLYTPNGKQYEDRYDKIHLVPFGEYIPFKNSFKPLYNLAVKLSPYDYDYSLGRGDEYTIFDISAEQRNYRFGTLICYEDTDPEVTRKMVVGPDGKKKADWLVNLSNDGWYVKYKAKKVRPSVELSQRTVITIFRAIENRISVIRSVNTGISCIIDSVGRIRDGFGSGTLPERAMDRQGVAGWLVDTVDIDKRVTFFSLHGKILDKICGVFFVIVPILMLLRMRINKKKS